MPDQKPASFGRCCEALRDAMAMPHSQFRIDRDVLFLVVGHTESKRPQFFDHAVFYCPFCGKPLQTPRTVRRKLTRD